MHNPQSLVIFLLRGQVSCFRQAENKKKQWTHELLSGEPWFSLADTASGLSQVLAALNSRINQTSQLAAFDMQILYADDALPYLETLGRDVGAVACRRYQLLRWEPLLARTIALTGNALPETLPTSAWMIKNALPVLEATFHYQEDALAAERARAEKAHEETIETLRQDRVRLEADIAVQRDQLEALQEPEMADVLRFLPALYRNAFGVISPSDLALLVGCVQVPEIASPFPEPSSDTLLTLQKQLKKLPEMQAKKLQIFCKKLQHKLDVRAEMKDWLGEKE